MGFPLDLCVFYSSKFNNSTLTKNFFLCGQYINLILKAVTKEYQDLIQRRQGLKIACLVYGLETC